MVDPGGAKQLANNLQVLLHQRLVGLYNQLIVGLVDVEGVTFLFHDQNLVVMEDLLRKMDIDMRAKPITTGTNPLVWVVLDDWHGADSFHK